MKYLKFLLILFVIILFFIAKIVVFKTTENPHNQNTVLTNKPTITSGHLISSGNVPNIPLQLAQGFTIHVFTSGLRAPRDLAFSPGGTLLVSTPDNNQILALPDSNHKGGADLQKIVVGIGIHPHGIAFYNNMLFVAEINKVVRYAWNEKTLEATFDKTLFSLPNNKDHINRTITFDSNGTMYVSVGSTCNVCYEQSSFSATVLVSNANGDNPRVFAKGLRNAPFTAINPRTNELWGTEMGRDYLGDNLPPDEINNIQGGKNYGWPFCYGNKIHDTNFDLKQTNPCANTEAPIFEIPAHSAPLGLTFIASSQFPKDWQNDLLVAYHGSWNRSIPTGYKVVHLTISGNTITKSEDFLTGFFHSGVSLGRPVDLIFDNAGNLYISDDKAGNIYIVQKSS